MIRKVKGEFVAECNDCGEHFYGGVTDDFNEFVADLKAASGNCWTSSGRKGCVMAEAIQRTPWESRARELDEKEGHYSDYAAFLEWFDKQLESGPWSELRDIIEAAEPNGMIPIYSIISDAYSSVREMPNG